MCSNTDKWDNRFMDIAQNVGTWSKDSTGIGAVIVGKSKQILSQGYNGFPRSLEDKAERITNREEKLKYTIHAEANAIFNAALNGVDIKGSTIYVSGLPCCSNCALAIIQSDIETVVMDTLPDGKLRWKESAELALEMFKESGIAVKIKQ